MFLDNPDIPNIYLYHQLSPHYIDFILRIEDYRGVFPDDYQRLFPTRVSVTTSVKKFSYRRPLESSLSLRRDNFPLPRLSSSARYFAFNTYAKTRDSGTIRC